MPGGGAAPMATPRRLRLRGGAPAAASAAASAPAEVPLRWPLVESVSSPEVLAEGLWENESETETPFKRVRMETVRLSQMVRYSEV